MYGSSPRSQLVYVWIVYQVPTAVCMDRLPGPPPTRHEKSALYLLPHLFTFGGRLTPFLAPRCERTALCYRWGVSHPSRLRNLHSPERVFVAPPAMSYTITASGSVLRAFSCWRKNFSSTHEHAGFGGYLAKCLLISPSLKVHQLLNLSGVIMRTRRSVETLTSSHPPSSCLISLSTSHLNSQHRTKDGHRNVQGAISFYTKHKKFSNNIIVCVFGLRVHKKGVKAAAQRTKVLWVLILIHTWNVFFFFT